jgi:hypothetical protein
MFKIKSIEMEDLETNVPAFSEISIEEGTGIFGGRGFAYDAGRALRFLGIAASGAHGTSMAIIDWISTAYIRE